MCVKSEATSSGQSMLWSADFHVNRTPSPASDSGRPTSGTCGPSTHGSFEPSDPVGSLLRMSLVCALPPQMRSSVTWKKRATPAGRPWWVLSTSELVLLDSEYGLWPRPAARDWKQDGKYRSAQSRYSPCLPAAVCIAESLAGNNVNTSGRSQDWLNVRWECQLMGFPPDWFDLPPQTLSSLWATPSSPKSPKRSAKRSTQ